MERSIGFFAAAIALVDLLQVPLVLAVYVAVRLARPLGAAWKATGVAFAGYAAWVIVTARLVPFTASGTLLVLAGLVLSPGRDASPERAWALGSLVAVVLFWIVPTVVVWMATRRRRLR